MPQSTSNKVTGTPVLCVLKKPFKASPVLSGTTITSWTVLDPFGGVVTYTMTNEEFKNHFNILSDERP